PEGMHCFTLEINAEFAKRPRKDDVLCLAQQPLPLPLWPVERPYPRPAVDAAEPDDRDVQVFECGFIDRAARRRVLIRNLSANQFDLDLARLWDEKRPVQIVGDYPDD